MYSRYHDRAERSVQLPDNYSGCAFSAQQPQAPEPSYRIDVAKPTPHEENPPIAMPPPPRVALPPLAKEGEKEAKKADEGQPTALQKPQKEHPVGLPSGMFGALGHSFPFTHGIGFDELLLIGLIILLSKNEHESDLILWLGLLLFCG